jgi:hypothetical protein
VHSGSKPSIRPSPSSSLPLSQAVVPPAVDPAVERLPPVVELPAVLELPPPPVAWPEPPLPADLPPVELELPPSPGTPPSSLPPLPALLPPLELELPPVSRPASLCEPEEQANPLTPTATTADSQSRDRIFPFEVTTRCLIGLVSGP